MIIILVCISWLEFLSYTHIVMIITCTNITIKVTDVLLDTSNKDTVHKHDKKENKIRNNVLNKI